MKLKNLIKDLDIQVAKGSKELDITGLTSNSKWAAPGTLFIAKKGMRHDGNEYIGEAQLAGAVAVLTDIYNPFLENITQLITRDVKLFEPILAARFYENPSSELFLTGVTGTSGKTTTTYLIYHLLEKCGLIGGIERIIGEHRAFSDLTTLDLVTCQKLLREMVTSGLRQGVMEVSSHGLHQDRVAGVGFDVAVFTNLSQEHLDYHKTMDAYAKEKAKIFSQLKSSGHAVINIDDEWSGYMMAHSFHPITTFGIEKEADYRAKNIVYSLEETRFTLGEYEIRVPLVGRFNVYNVLAAIAVARIRGIPMETIQKRLLDFPPVSGRMQRVGSSIFVDYAHKPAALANVLKMLRALSGGKIITVFGCGGDRDREKRPMMAQIAEEYSDDVIVTNDNPRSEDPVAIIEEIKKGFALKKHTIEMDRKKAIETGVSLLREGDVLLIAGKGHEKKQIIGGKTIEFDDVKVAEEMLNTIF